MAIAQTLKEYLETQGVRYEVVRHPRTLSSMRTAEAAHVPGDRLAKSVLLEDDDGYVMLVIPATHYVRLDPINRQLHRRLRFADEDRLPALFRDCDLGAIPPVGTAYGIETLLDDSLTEEPDVYFEAGDHEALLHMSAEEFRGAMRQAEHGHFSRHA